MRARLNFLTMILFLTGGMSCCVSGVATWRAIGLVPDFVHVWLVQAWPPSWATAYPAALIIAPLARRIANLLVPPRSPQG